MLKQLKILILLLPVIILFTGVSPSYAAKLKPMYKPEVMRLDGEKSEKEVKQAIIRAATNRNWTTKTINHHNIRVTFKKPGKISTVYKIVLHIKYNKKSIAIKYHSSRDLGYNAEAGAINNRYNKWLRKLEKEIWKEVNRG